MLRKLLIGITALVSSFYLSVFLTTPRPGVPKPYAIKGGQCELGWRVKTGPNAGLPREKITLTMGQKKIHRISTLIELDSNKDSILSAEDSAFSEIKLWVDSNKDGLITDDELSTFTDINVISVSLDETPFVSPGYGDGFYAPSPTRFSDGSEVSNAKVFRLLDQKSAMPIPSNLPGRFIRYKVRARGDLMEFRDAEGINPILYKLVTDFETEIVNGLEPDQLLEEAEVILREWSGTSSDLKLVEQLQCLDYSEVISANGLTVSQEQFLKTFIEAEAKKLSYELAFRTGWQYSNTVPKDIN